MSDYYLDALTAADCEVARQWRNTDAVRVGLRTPYMQTVEQQGEFYRRIGWEWLASHRYWAVRVPELAGAEWEPTFLAMVGLTNIIWENGSAEISLLVDPKRQGEGSGKITLRLVLTEAFDRMRLQTVFGEVYHCNPGKLFWPNLWDGHVEVPRRKLWSGELHGAFLFWFLPSGKWRNG